MTVQTLISTMFQKDRSLLSKMNIQTDAVVINQCDEEKTEVFTFRGHSILWVSCRDRGVGNSRNKAIELATADIVLFADDDMVYYDGYGETVAQAFSDHPEIAVFAFQVDNLGDRFLYKKDTVLHRLNLYNSLRYGTLSFCCRLSTLKSTGVRFSLLFGGGAQYCCGEDSLFLTDIIKTKCKVYAIPQTVGSNTLGESTWFSSFNQKYFYDKGVLMYKIYRQKAYILAPVLILRHPDWYREIGLKKALQQVLKGTLCARKI